MPRPLVVYLDWNVVVSLYKRGAHDLLALLEQERDAGRVVLPYAATHVEEANNIRAANEAQRRADVAGHLDFLSRLTQDLYIYDAINAPVPEFRRVPPHSTLETITEVTFGKGIMERWLKALSNPAFLRANRPALGLDPSKLNEIEPPNVIEKLDATVAVAVAGRPELREFGVGVRPLLERTLGSFPRATTGSRTR